MKSKAFLLEARNSFHAALLAGVLKRNEAGIPTNADKDNKLSKDIAEGIMSRLGLGTHGEPLPGQQAGARFEKVCEEFIRATLDRLRHLRPDRLEVRRGDGLGTPAIAAFEQYSHLADLDAAAEQNPTLAIALGRDYLIKPDVLVIRQPEADEAINAHDFLVDDRVARLTSLRRSNHSKPTLHALISCKWTLRSDRAQNARSEALCLIRNRKGRLPHICVVTGEPTPSRISSLALGTGDIDCVYHFALPELRDSVQDLGNKKASGLLATMIEGKRLKDISDLPLDLTV